MDGWDIALLAAAGYLAVTALVKLMIRRRDQLREEFRQELEREKRRRNIANRQKMAEQKQAS